MFLFKIDVGVEQSITQQENVARSHADSTAQNVLCTHVVQTGRVVYVSEQLRLRSLKGTVLSN